MRDDLIYDTKKLGIETSAVVERLKTTPATVSCVCGSTGPFSRLVHSDQDHIEIRFALTDTCAACGKAKIVKKLTVDMVEAGIIPAKAASAA